MQDAGAQTRLGGEGVRKIFIELELLGLILGGRGRFSWLQAAEIALRPNRRCIRKIKVLSHYLEEQGCNEVSRL